MTKEELKKLLINKIKENKGETPRELNINGNIYLWSGGQKIRNSYLYRYRNEKIDINEEKQIVLPF